MKFQSEIYKIAVLPVLFFCLTSCNKTYKGEGAIVSDARETGKFSQVALNMNARVIITDTTVNYCIVNAQANLQEAIVTRLDGNTLVITSKGTIDTDMPIEIRLGISQATAFEVNGSGEIRGMNTIKNEEVDFEVNGSGLFDMEIVAVNITGAVSGSGTAVLKGSSNELRVEINGSGTVDGSNLTTLQAKANISGSGEATLMVSQSLDAEVTGSGVIKYKGNAVVKQEVGDSGKVIKLD